MVHCPEYWRKWRKEPNFCGLGKQLAKRYDRYIQFVDDFSKKYEIPPETVYQNAPQSAVNDLLRFKESSDIRIRATEKIAQTLREKKGITAPYVKKLIGIDATPKAFTQPSVITAVSGISKEIIDNTKIKDRIRLLLNTITTGQHKILLEIMERENLDDEYAALTKALIWARERLNEEQKGID